MIALFLLLAADPEGTVPLEVQSGHTVPITTGAGASVICDDISVAQAEFTEDGNGFVLRGVKPGSTLCGVWLPNEMPGGLYRVRVTAAQKRDAGPPPAH